MPERAKHATRATARNCVKKIALEYAKAKRYHKFTQVSASFLDAVEANAMAFIRNRVEKHPSRGKTLT